MPDGRARPQGMTIAIIASVLLACIGLVTFASVAQSRAIAAARSKVRLALEAGPAPPLELTDRIAERFGSAPHHAVVSAALRDLALVTLALAIGGALADRIKKEF